MGFFDKVKQGLGIGGIKLELTVAEEFQKADGQVTGTVVVTSKSDQNVKSIDVKVTEHWSTGIGTERQTKNFELGKVTLSQAFTIKVGETKEIPFTVGFTILKSENDRMKEQGGVMGGLGKVGSFLDAEKSTYEVDAVASVEGTLIPPTASKKIKLV